MKLLIIHTCVVEGGKIIEAGNLHDTRNDNPESDKQAYQLIASGRAIQADSEEAKEILDGIKAAAEAPKKGK